MGTPLEGPAKVFCDNKAYRNDAIVESKLRQKHNSINFHLVREAVVARKMLVSKIDGNENLADLLTNSEVQNNVHQRRKGRELIRIR